MKNLLYILSAAILLTATSCADLLYENPTTSYSQEELYSTVGGIEGVLAGAWAPVTQQHGYSQTYPALALSMSGSFIYNQTGAAWNAINKWEMTAGFSNLYNYWTLVYQSIRGCNNLIHYASGSEIEQAQKDRLMGEAHLLRAMMYFDLVRLFGGVPLRLEPTDEYTIYASRATASEVYAQIIFDLQKAETLMVDKGEQKMGRPHKWAATALLAKVYMVMAGNRASSVGSLDAAVTDEMLSEKYLEPDKNPERTTAFWLLAYKKALDVYNSAQYTMVGNFADLWDVSKQNSTESIIELQYSSTLPGAGASLARVFLFKNSAEYAPQATTYLGAIRPRRQVYRLFADGDPRRGHSFITTTKSVYNPSTGATTSSQMFPAGAAARNENYPYIKKYKDPSVGANGAGNENVLYMRFAEIYLILAECVNEIEGGPANAYPYVNAVLERARKSSSPASAEPMDWADTASDTQIAVTTQVAFRKAILEERFRELMAEFNEFSDYRRRGIGKFAELLSWQNEDYQDPSVGGWDVNYRVEDPVWLKRYMLMPIPLTEINENIEIDVTNQNFGY